jgi:hypothetical protein
VIFFFLFFAVRGNTVASNKGSESSLPSFALESGTQSASELQSRHVFRNLQPHDFVDMGANWAVAVSTGATQGRGLVATASPRIPCVFATVTHIYILLIIIPCIFSALTTGLHPVALIFFGITITATA